MTAPALLFDTFSLFFRAYHALPPMSTRAGAPTSALYGFSALLLKLLREHRGAAVAFALDAPDATFRHLAFADYKGGRAPLPPALGEQLRRLPALLDALAVPVFRVPGFEADDILATLARRARHTQVPALVVSGDRDLLQLARGSVRIDFVGRRGKDAVVYDEAAVLERFGVPAAHLPAYVAMVGDVADNLPGVPGIGPATAAKLLRTVPTCSELLAELDRIAPARVRAILEAHREQILRSEDLARLRDDVPLPIEGLGWSVPTPASLRALGDQFEDLEFRSLAGRLASLVEPGEPAAT